MGEQLYLEPWKSVLGRSILHYFCINSRYIIALFIKTKVIFISILLLVTFTKRTFEHLKLREMLNKVNYQESFQRWSEQHKLNKLYIKARRNINLDNILVWGEVLKNSEVFILCFNIVYVIKIIDHLSVHLYLLPELNSRDNICDIFWRLTHFDPFLHVAFG